MILAESITWQDVALAAVLLGFNVVVFLIMMKYRD